MDRSSGGTSVPPSIPDDPSETPVGSPAPGRSTSRTPWLACGRHAVRAVARRRSPRARPRDRRPRTPRGRAGPDGCRATPTRRCRGRAAPAGRGRRRASRGRRVVSARRSAAAEQALEQVRCPRPGRRRGAPPRPARPVGATRAATVGWHRTIDRHLTRGLRDLHDDAARLLRVDERLLPLLRRPGRCRSGRSPGRG